MALDDVMRKSAYSLRNHVLLYILECDILAILKVCNIVALCICIYICIMYRFFIFVLCIYILLFVFYICVYL